MSEATTLQRLRDANPYPDAAALRETSPDRAVLLAVIEERTHIVSTQLAPPVSPPEKPKRRRGLVAAAAAFVLAIVAIGLVMLVDGGTPEPVSPTPTVEQPIPSPTTAETSPSDLPPPDTSPTESTTVDVTPGTALDVALAFIDARNRYDGQALLSLLSPDATIFDVSQDAGEYAAVAELERILGFEFQSVECNDTSIEGLLRAFCTFEFESAWSRALGLGPVGENNMRIIVEDGQIQDLFVQLNFPVLDEMQTAFASWLLANHPEALVVMFSPDAEFVNVPILTPESIELFEQYTPEYLADSGQSG